MTNTPKCNTKQRIKAAKPEINQWKKVTEGFSQSTDLLFGKSETLQKLVQWEKRKGGGGEKASVWSGDFRSNTYVFLTQ